MKNIMMNQNGATSVEFAILLPVLLLFIFGIIDFSTFFYNKAMITNASREAARAGTVFRYDPVLKQENRLTADDMEDVVNNYLENKIINFGGGSNNFSFNPEYIIGENEDLFLNVVIYFDHKFLILPDFTRRFFGGNLSDNMNLSARTLMRMEYQIH